MVTGDSLGEPRCPDHLLHGRDPRQPRPAPGCRCRGRPGRDGRVPLLRRPRPRLGVAGAAPLAAARAVRPHVGDARRRDRDRRRPVAAHRTRRPRASRASTARCRCTSPTRGRPCTRPSRSCSRPARRRSTSCTSRRPPRWSGRRRSRRSGSSRREQRDEIAEAIGGFRFTTGVRQDALALRARRHRRAPRRHAAALPPARRDARPARAAPRDLRHRHARRRHQRADPHRADHRAREVRRAADAAAQRARVPPDRGSRGPRRLRHRRHGRRDGARARDRERGRRRARRATTRRSSRRSCARRRPQGFVNWGEGSFERLVAAEPEPLAPQLQLTAAMLINVIARGGDVFGEHPLARLRQPRAARPQVRAGAPRARHLPHAARRRRRRDRAAVGAGRSPTSVSPSTCSRTSRSTSRSRRSRSPRSGCSTPTRRRGRGSAPATTRSTS